jgi:hypothetical protein
MTMTDANGNLCSGMGKYMIEIPVLICHTTLVVMTITIYDIPVLIVMVITTKVVWHISTGIS